MKNCFRKLIKDAKSWENISKLLCKIRYTLILTKSIYLLVKLSKFLFYLINLKNFKAINKKCNKNNSKYINKIKIIISKILCNSYINSVK